MTADLTPPADAPLPWSIDDDGCAIRDDNEFIVVGTGVFPLEDARVRYLVACANAAPGLVAERDALVAALHDALNALNANDLLRVTVNTNEKERDAALARIAALEAETAALRDALIDTIALALDARDLRRRLSAVRKVANDTSRPFDWANVQTIIDAPLETP